MISSIYLQHAGISQEIDQQLVKKIDELIQEGVSDVNEMRRHLKIFVKNEIFGEKNLPNATNFRYYPRPKTIRNHMVHSKRKLLYSMIDQECLAKKVDEWRREDPSRNIYFRPKASSSGDPAPAEDDNSDISSDEEDLEDIRISDYSCDSLLFVYQSSWQRRLLLRYGNELALLDATYRTTRYAIPLFFLVVKTNIDYQIVATFVCESESTATIQEALQIIKDWNPQFTPRYFMTDYSNEEITATERVFDGKKNCCFVVLNHLYL